MTLLEGKTALITGGSRGIGKAIVLAMAAEGADIVFTYLHNNQLAQEVAQAVERMGRQCLAVQADASDMEKTAEVVAAAIERFGHIDILINNAGITSDNLLIRMTTQQWDKVMVSNVNSTYNYCKAIAPHMLSRRSGSIINISSIVGLFGNAGQCNYAASKGAIIAFTKALSKELGSRNIRVNGIAPGFIQTEMTQDLPEELRAQYLKDIALHRLGKPEDVANLAVFLASDKASYITGEIINCSGNIKS